MDRLSNNIVPSRRIASIDAFRIIAILAVIFFHSNPFMENQFDNTPYRIIGLLFKQSILVAVPFFFITSGYFFGKKIYSGNNPDALFKSYFKRLLTIFLFWSVVYIVLPTDLPELRQYGYLKTTYWKIDALMTNPLKFIFEGAKVHLWFLAALIYAFWLLTFFIKRGMDRHILLFSIILYVIGLIGGSYADTPFGINSIPFNTRNGPFISTLFVTIGWLFSSDKVRCTPCTATWLIIAGLALHLSEVFILWHYFSIDPFAARYLLGTVFLVSGITLFLLSKPGLTFGRFLPALGKYTLGVYASHIIFIGILNPLDNHLRGLYWDILFPFIIYILSLSLSFILARSKALKVVVV